MQLEVYEEFSNGKFMGVFTSDKEEPPKRGEELSLGKNLRTRVKQCDETRQKGTYRIIVKRL